MFKFGNQNKQETDQYQDEQHIPEQPYSASYEPSQPPANPVAKEEENQRSFFRKKSKKDEFSSLFKIDIYNIFKYEPKLEGEVYRSGKPAKKYTFKLSELELATFYKVDIFQFQNGDYELLFRSNINELRDGLKEFVDFCVKDRGLDFMNKGGITQEDYDDAYLGIFSRVWHNFLRIENINFRLTLTIYDIPGQ